MTRGASQMSIYAAMASGFSYMVAHNEASNFEDAMVYLRLLRGTSRRTCYTAPRQL